MLKSVGEVVNAARHKVLALLHECRVRQAAIKLVNGMALVESLVRCLEVSVMTKQYCVG